MASPAPKPMIGVLRRSVFTPRAEDPSNSSTLPEPANTILPPPMELTGV